MKRKIFVHLLLVIGFTSILLSGCKKDENPGNQSSSTVTDFEGNVYHTVTIGTQVWMVENLKTTKYNDGTDIQIAYNGDAWGTNTPKYCWCNNDVANKNTYGALYNWQAINTGKLAPKGWHVPTNAEWETLVTYLGGKAVAGGKLKETGTNHWKSPNGGATNDTGFTGLPGGLRGDSGSFDSPGGIGYWWSSTESKYNDIALFWSMNYYDNQMYGDQEFKGFGFSVRCIKD